MLNGKDSKCKFFCLRSFLPAFHAVVFRGFRGFDFARPRQRENDGRQPRDFDEFAFAVAVGKAIATPAALPCRSTAFKKLLLTKA